MFDRYLVKDKYTYERTWQKDYGYDKEYLPYSYVNGCVLSHNYVPDLYLEETGETILDCSFSAEKPAEKNVKTDFKDLTGIRVRVSDAEDDTVIRVTFFGAGNKSFSSVLTAGRAKDRGVCFSLSGMDFKPKKIKAETDGETASCIVETVYVWNTIAEWGGQAHFHKAVGKAKITDAGASMKIAIKGNSGIESRELPTDAGGCYSMKMPLRNTVYVVMKNRSDAKTATLFFRSTESPEYCDENSVTLELSRDDVLHGYYFNLSECPGCKGRLTGWKILFEGKGEIEILSYSYEQEKSIAPDLAYGIKAVADVETNTVKVTGRLTKEALKRYKNGKLSLYCGTMADDEMLGRRYEKTGGKGRLASIPFPKKEKFTIDGIPLKDGKTTLLMYQLLLFAEDNETTECLCPRFLIENYECIDKNKYAFKLPKYTVNVLERGAAGDGFTNDTDAIQSAIDEVNEAGGGRVFLPGAEGIYGRRYVVTNLLIRDNVDLHFGDGAVLWQSPRAHDYPYEPAYGHDGVIPGINWTHNLHVSNLPLIQGNAANRIKITGKGAIRMCDVGSEEGVGMPGYAVGCYRRIHAIPLGLFICENIECTDFEVIRSNNYNTDFNKCSYLYVGNVKCHEVKCVSGDGYGVGGTKHAHVNRCFLQSNDDGIVMTTHQIDPRGILWWTNLPEEDNSVDDVVTTHSYINSGGGKCLAFITWGTNDKNQSHEEIRNIVAYDNCLVGVNPVGAWYDNPYNGKQPFDNSETDDYSPVKNVRIFDNEYVGNCTLGPIQGTNIITDCGVRSSSAVQNGDFSLGGLANWTTEGLCDTVIFCDKEKGRIRGKNGAPASCAQGLYLEAGKHTLSCEVMTGKNGAELYASKISTGGIIKSVTVVSNVFATAELTFEITDCEADDVFVGIRCLGNDGEYAVFDKCSVKSEVDRDAIKRLIEKRFADRINGIIELSDDFKTEFDSGKVFLRTNAMNGENRLAFRGNDAVRTIQAAVKTNDINRGGKGHGYGFRFAVSESGKTYRELRFNDRERTLVLKDVDEGKETELYRRENFFFTSLDFHLFKLEIGEKDTVIWVDGSMYGAVKSNGKRGKAELFITEIDATINI